MINSIPWCGPTTETWLPVSGGYIQLVTMETMEHWVVMTTSRTLNSYVSNIAVAILIFYFILKSAIL